MINVNRFELQNLLNQYDLADPEIHGITRTTHLAYKVIAGSENYVIRIAREDASKMLRHEAQILSKMGNQLQDLPRVLKTRSGELMGEADGLVCLITTWLDGFMVTLQELTESDCKLLGAFLSRWHLQTLAPQSTDEIENLFGLNSPYPLPELLSNVTDEQQIVIQNVFEVMGTDLRAGAASALLHGDFLLQNILIDVDTVRMIDLEYSRVGYPLYDLAPLLWQVRVRDDWRELQMSYVEAYSQVRKISKADHKRIESYIVARHIASLHWIAHNPDNPHVYPYAEAILAHRIAELEGFLQTGFLLRNPFVA